MARPKLETTTVAPSPWAILATWKPIEVSSVTPATRMFLPSRMPTNVPFCRRKRCAVCRSVAHAEAAVDRDECPGDVAGRVAGKKLDRPRNVIHRAEPAQRDLLGVLLDQVVTQLGGHVGLNEARSDHIGGYPTRPKFARQGARQPKEPRLCCRVV